MFQRFIPGRYNTYYRNASNTYNDNDAAVTQPVLINVLDATGKQVYTVKGFANTEYRFGEEFKPGIYLVQLMRGAERSSIKLVKQ